MAQQWEGITFEMTVSTLGGVFLEPQPYRFRFVASRDVRQNIYLYTITPAPVLGPAPTPGPTPSATPGPAPAVPTPSLWADCKLLPQDGRRLTKFIPRSKRLVVPSPGDDRSSYEAALQDLADEILGEQIDADPFGYERLVGTVFKGGKFNPVSFYKVEHTHTDDAKILVLAHVNLVAGNPNGIVIVIG
ncbi:MAG: hypothetical protein WDO68_22285 [Gammaproteobacteria bacterium]